MKSKILLLIGLTVLLAVAISFKGGINSILRPPVAVPNEPVACTMDAKMCPDGSYVGRQGPNCEFTACPVATATTSRNTVEAFLNKPSAVGNIVVTPLEVIEDSRCPIDVVCIQAGTVRLRTRIVDAGNSSEQVFALGKDLTIGIQTIKLLAVIPAPKSTTPIKPADYVFTFQFTDYVPEQM
jgi:hypothetical protein